MTIALSDIRPVLFVYCRTVKGVYTVRTLRLGEYFPTTPRTTGGSTSDTSCEVPHLCNMSGRASVMFDLWFYHSDGCLFYLILLQLKKEL